MSEMLDLGPVPSFLVIDAVRYAIGRISTQPDTTARWLVAVWPRLDDATREIIRRDLEREFRHDDFIRSRGLTSRLPLGMDCDRQSWEMVRALWNNDLQQVENEES